MLVAGWVVVAVMGTLSVTVLQDQLGALLK
jgi:hypothetical protein